jgi:glyoxylase I family protein
VDRGGHNFRFGPAIGVGCRHVHPPLASVCMVTDPVALRSDAPITGLSHVQLLVSDVGVSAQWYAAALGLELYVEDLAIGYVALRHRHARMVIVLTSRSNGEIRPERDLPAETPHADRGGLDHLAFAVSDETDLHAWADHLAEIGVHHDGVVLENGNPSLQLRDPDGIAIELVAPGPGSTGIPRQA